jgi:hypothetical protein
VPGVGEQRHGIGEKAVNGFEGDKARVEGDADGEGLAEIFRGVDVAMTMRMSMVMVMTMAVVVRVVLVVRVVRVVHVVLVVRVVVRVAHGWQIYTSGAPAQARALDGERVKPHVAGHDAVEASLSDYYQLAAKLAGAVMSLF